MTFLRSQALRSAFLAMLIAIMFSGAALANGPTEFLVYGFPTKVGCPTPSGNLVADAAGNLYGTTCIGGTGHGTVYELMAPVPPSTEWTQVVLYTFTGGADGGEPLAGPVFDKAGNLYGNTVYGGLYGIGTVFELSPPAAGGDGWNPCSTAFGVERRTVQNRKPEWFLIVQATSMEQPSTATARPIAAVPYFD